MIKYDEKRYLSQFVLEMFDSLQEDSTKCAPLFELNNFIAMATYWVPDLPNIKDMAPLGVQFSYLQMVPDIHDPTSI